MLTYKWRLFFSATKYDSSFPAWGRNDPRSRPQTENHFRDVMIDDEGSCKRVTHALFVNQ